MGHILRIAPDFGRYTAVKYSAQDLAELKASFCSLCWGSLCKSLHGCWFPGHSCLAFIFKVRSALGLA